MLVEATVQEQGYGKEGEKCLLEISDNEEVTGAVSLSKLFEPYFTTKQGQMAWELPIDKMLF